LLAVGAGRGHDWQPVLPADVFKLLAGDKRHPYRSSWRAYDSEADATSALSSALIRWARQAPA